MSSDVFYTYGLLPHTVGRPTAFSFSDAEIAAECAPDVYIRRQYTLADPYETIIDNCPRLSESCTNTEKTHVEHRGQNHVDGGWPNSVDILEPEERNKYAKKLCRDERHVDVLKMIVPQMSSFLRLNGALNIYEGLFDASNKMNTAAASTSATASAIAAAEEERSRKLCPWRHDEKQQQFGGGRKGGGVNESIGGSSGAAAAAEDAFHAAAIGGNSGGGGGGGTNAAALLRTLTDGNSGGNGSNTKLREMSEIAYGDPSVVHALHVSCKLSIPVIDDSSIPIHGTTASQSKFTCGSGSTKIVVGYCEGILPARADVSAYKAHAAAMGLGTDGYGSSRGGNYNFGAGGASSSFAGISGSPYQFSSSALGMTGAGGFLGMPTSPSVMSARRSTAVSSPLFRGSGAAGAGGPSSRRRSHQPVIVSNNGGDEDDDDSPTADRAGASVTDGPEASSQKQNNSKNPNGDLPEQNASISLRDDAKRATEKAALKRQLSNAAHAGTDTLAPLKPAPLNEWGCAGAMWSTTDPSAHTNVFLSCNGGATAIVASYRDPNLVHGGMNSGMLEVWDIRQGTKPIMTSGRDDSHRDAVTCVKLVTTKATECFSCGLDGQVLFWDTRRLQSPVFEESVKLRDPITGAPLAATSIDFDPLVGGTLKYLVSTVEGKVLSCGRRANKNGEKVLGVFDCHYGACFSTMRCPAVPKVFATCGDWGFKLFGDELKSSPLFTSPLVSSYVLCGVWHPTRHCIFMTGTSSGDVCFYDILRTANGPVMKIRASSSPIRHLEPHVSGQTVAATDATGEVHIIALPSVLYEPTVNERRHVVAALEREYGRERISEGVEAQLGFGGAPAAGLVSFTNNAAVNTSGGGGFSPTHKALQTASNSGFSNPLQTNMMRGGSSGSTAGGGSGGATPMLNANGPSSTPTAAAMTGGMLPPVAAVAAADQQPPRSPALLVRLVVTEADKQRRRLRAQKRGLFGRIGAGGDGSSSNEDDDDDVGGGYDDEEIIIDDDQSEGSSTPTAAGGVGEGGLLRRTTKGSVASKNSANALDATANNKNGGDSPSNTCLPSLDALPTTSLAHAYLGMLGVPIVTNPYAPLSTPPEGTDGAIGTTSTAGATVRKPTANAGTANNNHGGSTASLNEFKGSTSDNGSAPPAQGGGLGTAPGSMIISQYHPPATPIVSPTPAIGSGAGGGRQRSQSLLLPGGGRRRSSVGPHDGPGSGLFSKLVSASAAVAAASTTTSTAGRSAIAAAALPTVTSPDGMHTTSAAGGSTSPSAGGLLAADANAAHQRGSERRGSTIGGGPPRHSLAGGGGGGGGGGSFAGRSPLLKSMEAPLH